MKLEKVSVLLTAIGILIALLPFFNSETLMYVIIISPALLITAAITYLLEYTSFLGKKLQEIEQNIKIKEMLSNIEKRLSIVEAKTK